MVSILRGPPAVHHFDKTLKNSLLLYFIEMSMKMLEINSLMWKFLEKYIFSYVQTNI